MRQFRQIVKSTLNGLLPRSLFLTRGRELRIGSALGNASGPAISLTFDDGPHPEHTPALLDELEAAKIEVTFFIVGEQAEKHPDLVRRIAEAGHELGNHTWTHSEPRRTSTARFLSELRRTREFLEDLTGEPCRLVRPPKGELSPGKLIGLLATKQPVALWNCDTKDYAMTDPTVIGRWVAGYSPSHGDIVLMHDVHPHAVAGIAMMRKLHAYRDVRFRRVSDWLPGSHASFNAEPQATAFHRTEPPPCADPAPAAGR
jgi:peptidoglycan/xylan/chitin deacetylase (PgdA/CDA1 family)